MAKKTRFTPTPELIASDVHIEIWERARSYWYGAAEQLKSEGLIPDGFSWPKGRNSKHWDDQVFHYSLVRSRPLGFKGPMKAWAVDGDWWCMDIGLLKDMGTGLGKAVIYEKRRELERAVWQQTCSYNEMFMRYWKAHEDKTFQRFLERAIQVPVGAVSTAAG